jgi:hypothetical protein
MSHSQTVKVTVSNTAALASTAKEMEAKDYSTEVKDVKLYDGTYKGMFVHFKDWRYPVVISDGNLVYDSYNGLWGNEQDIGRFRQGYAANVVRIAGINDGKSLISDTMEGNNRIVMLDNGDGSQTKATIPAEGDAILEVVGCSGSVCQSHTSGVSSALGVATSDYLKPEFQEQERVREREQE